MNTLDRHLACQICFENFRHTGEHVPRLLPCTHTLCETCIEKLITANSLTCPECRVKHIAKNEVKSFPQNKYILMNLRRKSSVRKVSEPVEKCKEHGFELILFCRDPECQKEICINCLTKDHVGHKVVDLEEGHKSVLLAKVETLRKDLLLKKHRLSKTKSEIESKNSACREVMKEKKEGIIQMINERFEELSQNIADETVKTNSVVEEEMAVIDDNFILLDSLIENTDKKSITRQESTTRLETVRDIETQVKIQLSEKKTFTFIEYEGTSIVKEDVNKLCGDLTPKDLELEVTEPKDIDLMVAQPKVDNRDKRQHASEYTCQATNSIHTTKGSIYGLCLIGNTAMVYRGGNELAQYRLATGGESRIIQLLDQPNGIAPVTLAGKCCLALSYKNKHKIEFRDATNLARIIHSYSVSPHQPWTLCTLTLASSSPTGASAPPAAPLALGSSTLLYEDTSKNPSTVRWLDCGKSPPKPSVENVPITTDQYFLKDICIAQDEDKELLIISTYTSKVQAYDTNSGKLQWTVDGKLDEDEEKDLDPSGLAADGSGHLFVCDTKNKCIQMFHVSDGRYMGVLIKQGQQGLGEPHCVKWCKKTSSLVVAHAKKKYNHISVIKVL